MIIESGSDLLLILNLTDEKGNRIRVNTKSSFTIRVYTTDRKKYLEYSKFDVVTSNDYDKLYINSNELEVLESGVITYTYMYGVGDKNFNDGEYNNQKTVYTDYYFKNISNSAAPSNPVNYKVIEEIKDSIKQETDRATAVEGSLFNKIDEHQKEVTNRINNEINDTTSKVNTEASERKDADTVLQGNIDKLSQTVSSNKTASDKAISDVSTAVKSETTRATAKESALEGKITSLTNTVSSNKTATDKAVSDEITRAKAAESANSTAISNEVTRAKEAEAKALQDAKNDAAAKYQIKGNYLTSHQDISGKVDKVAGKGLSTNDYTTAEKKKLASLPDDFEGPCTEDDIKALFA